MLPKIKMRLQYALDSSAVWTKKHKWVCANPSTCTSYIPHLSVASHKPSGDIIAKPEGEATNLDAQVDERLYICMYICIHVRHSQLRTPLSWPRNCICSYSYGQLLLHISL